MSDTLSGMHKFEPVRYTYSSLIRSLSCFNGIYVLYIAREKDKNLEQTREAHGELAFFSFSFNIKKSTSWAISTAFYEW